jgi:N-acetyl-anhydromuramyl-L-alanine amidase AmpD
VPHEELEERESGMLVPRFAATASANISRKRPHVNVTHWSPNKSSRGGAHCTLIVVHVTAGHNRPGLVDLQGLASWFGSSGSQVSSHVCTDNEAHSARFVRDGEKAWHCAGYNRMALGIEQVAPGNGTEITRQMYRETARWIAQWSREYGIPIRKAVVGGGGVSKAGVIRHSELGALGGGHSDPGRYDLDACLNLARFYRASL